MNQVGVSKEYNIFELQRAILAKDPLLANKIVNYFESNTTQESNHTRCSIFIFLF